MVSAKDSLYRNIVDQYNHYLRLHPDDVSAHLERCRFIESAYYDEYEDYNPNYEESEACVNELLSIFPQNPEVLLFASDFIYGDSLQSYLIHLEKLANENPTVWRAYNWQIFSRLAEQYSYNERHTQTILYAERAAGLNDTLDVSLLLAEAYKALAKHDQAVEVLIQRLDSTNAAWDLNRKGRLLLELGQPEKALEAFNLATQKSSGIEDAAGLANALTENGLLTEAREYLLKDYHAYSWNADARLHKLLLFDLNYSQADSAMVTYRKLTDANFFTDPFGGYRIRLFFKDPLLSWSFGDVGRVLLLILILAIPFVLPYLWILPIHYIGSYLKQKGKIVDEATFRWRLRHFWFACSFWGVCSILTWLFFSYPSVVWYFNDHFESGGYELISKEHANVTIFFSTGCLLLSVAFLNWEEIKGIFPRLMQNMRAVRVGIGLAFLLKFGTGIYMAILKLMGVSLSSTSIGLASVKEAIISINSFYSPLIGFLIVVILVPFYEEILFRGVFLSACERNMKFMVANILQALVFALAHDELKLFPFYIAFGLVAGYYTRKTKSLITGTAMHMTNNFLAFIAIYLLQGRLSTLFIF